MMNDERESGPPRPHGDPLESEITAAAAPRTAAGPAGREGRRKTGDTSRVGPAPASRGQAAASPDDAEPVLGGEAGAVERLINGRHHDPHSLLGAHQTQDGVVVRAMHHAASRAEVVVAASGETHQMRALGGGLFGVLLADLDLPLRYRIRFYFPDGNVWERDDPYRFLPTLGEMDLHLFNEGTHRRLWEKLGAHPMTVDGVPGVAFAVWAPSAQRVSVLGDFSQWDGRVFPMRVLGSSGVWELFVPDVTPGALYKYEIVTQSGDIRVKTDPFAFKLEQHPGTASIVERASAAYDWSDGEWMARRDTMDPHRCPQLIYEVHLGSWARVPEEGDRFLTYREIAPRLADHVRQLGFTHVELLPVMEHPFYGSWGYQVSGYYAPTSRYGSPDDFRFFVDTMHRNGIGVILDWVPAHFPKDDFALRRFDGSALFEHEDPRLGEHPDWGTLIFNYGRAEVRNFLVANALFWLEEFHADGLRVDAVASMLYLDYSREPGEWMRNRYGGRENLEAIDFLRQLNETIRHEHPGCSIIAEESTAWPGVTNEPAHGGLGFTFKWNMGWMHDTLKYFGLDPIHRRWHQDQLTFAMIYEYSERFIMPLSHDEVVHGKGSLLNKMAGDEWQKFANLRALLAYMFTRPGKKLLFMGAEIAPWEEWNHEQSLEWSLLQDDPRRVRFMGFVSRLARLYRERSEFWRRDSELEGFSWISADDRENSVLVFARRDGEHHSVVILNLTPVPREHYRIGVPQPGAYREALNTDDAEWGGSGYPTRGRPEAQPTPFHGYQQSIELTLPPLSALVLVPERA